MLVPSRRGKLWLVLDLDHTLLNSATFAEVGPELGHRLAQQSAAEATSRPPDQRLLFQMDDIKVSALQLPPAAALAPAVGWARGSTRGSLSGVVHNCPR